MQVDKKQMILYFIQLSLGSLAFFNPVFTCLFMSVYRSIVSLVVEVAFLPRSDVVQDRNA